MCKYRLFYFREELLQGRECSRSDDVARTLKLVMAGFACLLFMHIDILSKKIHINTNPTSLEVDSINYRGDV